VWAVVHRRTVERRTWIGCGLALGSTALAIAGGVLVLRLGGPPPGPPSTVAIVQGNLGPAVRWSAEGPARTLETYQRLTRDVLARGNPGIVFWPEAALTAFVEQDDAHRRALAATLGGRDGELVIGAPRAGAPGGAPPYANSIYLVAPDGALGARYDKRYLLPFMEYFPLRLDFARRHFGRVREFSPGAPLPPLPTRAGAAGVLVCNEALLPHMAAERVAEGATYLVNPSNDSWVPDAGFAWQQFDIASFRAVEQRRWLVRVSDSGPSGVVDPMGRVVAHTEALTRDALLAEIAAIAAPSPYGQVGDLFGVACVLAAAIALFVARSAD
jgi:apolipoprotein N-acyltransferase